MEICRICQSDYAPADGETPYCCEDHQAGPPTTEPGWVHPAVDSARNQKNPPNVDGARIQGRLFDLPADSKH